MAFNGSGTFVREHDWTEDADNQIDIEAERMDEEDDGFAVGLSTCLTKDGQTVLTANIPFAGMKITGYGTTSTPSSRSDVPSLGQIQDGILGWVDGGGTADAITGNYSPTITSLTDGLKLSVRATTANLTTTPTFQPNAQTAHTIVQAGGLALSIGSIRGDGHDLILRYDLANTRWELLNPYPAGTATTSGNNDFTGVNTFTDVLAIKGNATNAGRIRLNEDTDNGTNYIELKPTQAVTSNRAHIFADRDAYVGFSSASMAENYTFTASVGSSALTIALKDAGGSDPTSDSPAIVSFRNATAATGDFTNIVITAATSIVVSSGSTLGTANSTAFRLWIVGFNDAGTFRLGVINCLSGTNIYPLGQFPIASSTAEGGAGGADSAQVFYTGTAVTSKAYRILGYVTYESGLGTAGTWSATPTRAQLYHPGVPLPGMPVQTQRSATSAVASGTTLIPFDDTIPQSSEGVNWANLSTSITPNSSSNLLEIDLLANLSHSAGNIITLALFQDANANASAAAGTTSGGADFIYDMPLKFSQLAATTSSTTFKSNGGSGTAGTITLNGTSGARKYGGVLFSSMSIKEIMA